MRSKRSRAGFTLVELIVSMAITSVIALFVFQFATSLAQVWRVTESGVSTELDAQIALDQISRDFESAIFQERDGVPMLAATALSKSDYDNSSRWVGIGKSARPEDWDFSPELHQYGWAGTWLRFFTASPSFNAVGYQLIRRPAFSDSEEPRYLLHRSLIRHDNTLEGGFDITMGAYPDGNTANALKNPRLDSVLLEDVIDFGVRFYVYDDSHSATVDTPDGLRLIFPADDGGKLDSSDTEHLGSQLSDSTFSSRYPELVEVFLRVLDDVGADMLYDLEEGVSTLTYEAIVKQHSRLYRRMIRLPGKEPQ